MKMEEFLPPESVPVPVDLILGFKRRPGKQTGNHRSVYL